MYAEIVGSINRMNKKLEHAKGNMPGTAKEETE